MVNGKVQLTDVIKIDDELFLKMKANFWEREALQEKINSMMRRGQELVEEGEEYFSRVKGLYGVDLKTTHEWNIETGKISLRKETQKPQSSVQ